MMKAKPTPTDRQVLILWALLVREGAVGYQKDLKPEPTPADREVLVASGLVDVNKEMPSRRILLTVTERGWAWASENLHHSLPERSTAGAEILRAWLRRVGAYLNVADVALADVISPQGKAITRNTDGSQAFVEMRSLGLRDRVRQAYLAVTGNRLNVRAKLAAVRRELEGVPSHELDETLKTMQREESAALYPLDNKTEITAADRQAAIYFGEEPRHILWISR
jgi:hypothetical protein